MLKKSWVINKILLIYFLKHIIMITDLLPMPAPEDDEEETRGGKGLKILTPNKLSTRLPILLA